MSISDQINQLTLDKTAIANAIVAKNGTVNTGDGFDNFADDIATIPSGGNLKDISPVTTNGTYRTYSDLHSVTGLTNTNNGYFKTSFVPDVGSTSYKIDFQFTATADTLSTTTRQDLFGCVATGGGCLQFTVYRSSGTGNFTISAIISKRAYNASIAINEGDVFTCSISNTEMVINGTSYSPSSYTTTGTGNQMSIFTKTDSDGSIASNSIYKGTINYLKIYDGTDLTYWFVPARSGTSPVFYDSVNTTTTAITGGSGITYGTDVSDLSYDGFASPLTVNVPEKLINGSSVEDFWSGYTTNHTITFTESSISSYGYQRFLQNGKGGNSKIIFNAASIYSYSLQYFSYGGNVSEISLDKVVTLSTNCCQYLAYDNKVLKKLSVKNLTSSTYNYAFGFVCYQSSYNYTLTEIDFSNLKTLSGSNAFYQAFYRQRGLYQGKVGHPFPKLETITGSSVMYGAFYYTRALMLVFDSLKTIATTATSNQMSYLIGGADMTQRDGSYYKCGLAFPVCKQIGYDSSSCSNAMSYIATGHQNYLAAYFDELTTIISAASSSSKGHFYNCQITYIFMPKVTDMGTYNQYCFYNSTNTSEIHFGIANQSTIEALSGYSSRFGLPTTVSILFDLANTITIGGVDYTRDGSKSDYDNWYFGWTDANSNTIYTDEYKGAVGDTVYSKSGTTYTATGDTVETIA